MQFTIGETLVYPHHGAVTITKLDKVMVKGEEKTYMTLDVHTSELTIKVPIDSAELVGPRAPWLADAGRRTVGRGALVRGREVTPVQVYDPG